MKKLLIVCALLILPACNVSKNNDDLARDMLEAGNEAAQNGFDIVPVDEADFPKVGDVLDFDGTEFKFVKISDEAFEYQDNGVSLALEALNYNFLVDGEIQHPIYFLGLIDGKTVKVDPTKPTLFVGDENWNLSPDTWKPGTYAILEVAN